jgi:hypothetical protein
LRPELNLKSRYEEIEDLASYADTLPDDAKEWLNQFSSEYINASFSSKKEPLHNTPELKKSCYDRNNARNRCQMTRKKASGEIMSVEDLRSKELESTEELVYNTNNDSDSNKEA